MNHVQATSVTSPSSRLWLKRNRRLISVLFQWRAYSTMLRKRTFEKSLSHNNFSLFFFFLVFIFLATSSFTSSSLISAFYWSIMLIRHLWLIKELNSLVSHMPFKLGVCQNLQKYNFFSILFEKIFQLFSISNLVSNDSLLSFFLYKMYVFILLKKNERILHSALEKKNEKFWERFLCKAENTLVHFLELPIAQTGLQQTLMKKRRTKKINTTIWMSVPSGSMGYREKFEKFRDTSIKRASRYKKLENEEMQPSQK